MSNYLHAGFPSARLRRARKSPALRRLVAETTLSSADLVYPMFVLPGEGRREVVASMPGIERLSIDGILAKAAEAEALGIPSLAIFPVIEPEQKSLRGEESANPEG
ncbi:MAG: porphobilinogen synthase, partial [Woeseia sp.]